METKSIKFSTAGLVHEAQFRFKDLNIRVFEPPGDLFKKLERAKTIDWKTGVPMFIPEFGAPQILALQKRIVTPPEEYWKFFLQGLFDETSPSVGPYWIIADTTEIKQADEVHETPEYLNDPFATMLAELRDEKLIEVPNHTLHLGQSSRFGLSPQEINNYFMPRFADLMEVSNINVGLNKLLEDLVISAYSDIVSPSKWGEWLGDKMHNDRAFFGLMDSKLKLTLGYDLNTFRTDQLGFRPIIRFPLTS